MNIEITDLTRRFGRNQAVAGVSLQAGPGVFGLLGPNGAGKTTLLRMMATVIPPTTGHLRLLGRDPGAYGPRREVRRRLGYLPQNLGYYPGFTVAEFVEYFALLKEMPAARVPAAVATAASLAAASSGVARSASAVARAEKRSLSVESASACSASDVFVTQTCSPAVAQVCTCQATFGRVRLLSDRALPAHPLVLPGGSRHDALDIGGPVPASFLEGDGEVIIRGPEFHGDADTVFAVLGFED